MSTSNTRADGARRKSSWLRRSHRWLGVGLAVFLLLLAFTGIALNHSDDWRLGNRYVTWSWLLDAYGIRAPEPSASFADNEHYAALLGQRLYFDDHEIADRVDSLTGLIVTNELAFITSFNRAIVLTADGELVENLDLSSYLPGDIERVGRLQDRVVIIASGMMFRSDPEMTKFDAWDNSQTADVVWSHATPLPQQLKHLLEGQYRGRGVSVERLVADLHSGRFIGNAGQLFMDVIAILLIILSVTGIFLWTRSWGRQNGKKR